MKHMPTGMLFILNFVILFVLAVTFAAKKMRFSFAKDAVSVCDKRLQGSKMYGFYDVQGRSDSNFLPFPVFRLEKFFALRPFFFIEFKLCVN